MKEVEFEMGLERWVKFREAKRRKKNPEIKFHPHTTFSLKGL